MYGELGLGFDACVGGLRHAGVDAGVLLREVGDQDAASSQQLHSTLAGERQSCGEEREKISVYKTG